MVGIQKCKNVYCCLHWKDKDLWLELRDHLAALVRLEYIILTSDLDILPGSDMQQTRCKRTSEADLILLLFSHYFLADNDCYAIAEQAKIRYQAGEAQVILIVLRPVHYSGLPIDALPRLPLSRPITSWPDVHGAFVDVVVGIRNVIKQEGI